MEKDKNPIRKTSQNETSKEESCPQTLKTQPSPLKSFKEKGLKREKEMKGKALKELKELERLKESKILDDLKKEKELKEKLKKQEEDFLYLKAEFDNYRKRMEKEKEDLSQVAIKHIILGLLEVMDNFERALSVKPTSKNLNTYVQGVEMTAQELRGTLERLGLESLDLSVGIPFDPTIHEALGNETNKEFPPGHISKVYKKAYKFKGKLLRPAQVMVVASTSTKSIKKEKT